MPHSRNCLRNNHSLPQLVDFSYLQPTSAKCVEHHGLINLEYVSIFRKQDQCLALHTALVE